MIAFDHRDGPAGLQDLFQRSQRLHRLGQMFEDEAHEDMIERFRRKRQMENVGLPERHILDACRLNGLSGFGDRRFRHVNGRNQRLRTIGCQGDRLRADPAPSLQDAASVRVGRIRMQQLHERRCLILQPQIFSRIVTMNVSAGHWVTVDDALLMNSKRKHDSSVIGYEMVSWAASFANTRSTITPACPR